MLCRYMVAIAGVPGSGKSTAAAEVSRRLNERREGTAQPDGCQLPCAIAVPMDGEAEGRAIRLCARADASAHHSLDTSQCWLQLLPNNTC